MVWLSGSLFLPLKKIRREIKLMNEKQMVNVAISLRFRSRAVRFMRRYPDATIRSVNNNSLTEYVTAVFKRIRYLMKSLTA